jgi:dTMP kinase
MTRGVLITFEGGEGTGKSTQIALLAERLRGAGLVVRIVREPGGTLLGESVRDILLDPNNRTMSSVAELLLYEASRAQLVAEVLVPALDSGEVVLLDRFYDSTTAYQAFGRGIPRSEVDAANHLATSGLTPDRTVVLDLDPELGVARATRSGADRLEAEDLAFHEAVREGFLALAAEEPDRVVVVDADGSPHDVSGRVAAALRGLPVVGRALGA